MKGGTGVQVSETNRNKKGRRIHSRAYIFIHSKLSTKDSSNLTDFI